MLILSESGYWAKSCGRTLLKAKSTQGCGPLIGEFVSAAGTGWEGDKVPLFYRH